MLQHGKRLNNKEWEQSKVLCKHNLPDNMGCGFCMFEEDYNCEIEFDFNNPKVKSVWKYK